MLKVGDRVGIIDEDLNEEIRKYTDTKINVGTITDRLDGGFYRVFVDSDDGYNHGFKCEASALKLLTYWMWIEEYSLGYRSETEYEIDWTYWMEEVYHDCPPTNMDEAKDVAKYLNESYKEENRQKNVYMIGEYLDFETHKESINFKEFRPLIQVK